MCAGNAPCAQCAQKNATAQMGYANDLFSTLGLQNLVGEKGVQINVQVSIPDDLWLKLGGTIVAIILLGTFGYYGIKKIMNA